MKTKEYRVVVLDTKGKVIPFHFNELDDAKEYVKGIVNRTGVTHKIQEVITEITDVYILEGKCTG